MKIKCSMSCFYARESGALHGFTLIELLVVVLIIGILAAVALPQYNKAVKRAQGREALVALDVLKKAMHAYYLEHGTYENLTVDALNIDIPELKYFRYSYGYPFSYQNATARLNRFSSVASPKGKSIYLLSPEGIYLSLQCLEDGGFTYGCFSYNNQTPYSCSDYFDCKASPRVQVQTPSSTFLTGGECGSLK